MEYKQKEISSIAAILEAYTDTEPGCWQIAYSGGKDSTVTAALVFKALTMLKQHQWTRKIYIVSAQTHLDLTTDPVKQKEIQRMKKFIDLFKLPVEIMQVEAKPESSFIYLVLGMGYPLPSNAGGRWCTDRLKIAPTADFEKEYQPLLKLIGVRSSESVSRGASIERHSISKYFGENNTFMPIVDWTLDDIWMYLAREKTPWGDAEDISQLYKDATGECGLRKRTAGKGEKADDPCGARFGCVICPVVTIDKSTKEMAKLYPWFQPYVELRNIMIEMYEKPENRAGYQRNGKRMFHGEGNFSIRARMELFDLFMQAQYENEFLANQHGVEPQPLFTDEIIDMIKAQWEKDAAESPYLMDSERVGLFFEERAKGSRGDYYNAVGQITWNHKYVG